MFEVVFIRRYALEKHRSAPLREERERFLNYLQGQGYSRQQLVTIANSLLHIVNAIGLASMRPVSEIEIMQAAEQWAGDTENNLTCPPGPGTIKVFRQCALRWFSFNDSLIPKEEVAPVCEDLVIAFKRGETERGVSGETVRSYSVRVRYFLDWYLARSTVSVPFGLPTSLPTWMRNAARAGMFERGLLNARHYETFSGTQKDRDGALPVSPEASRALESPNMRKLPEDLPGEICGV